MGVLISDEVRHGRGWSGIESLGSESGLAATSMTW